MKERNKQICYASESDNHEIKDGDSGEDIFIIDRVSREINNEELQYRLEEYGKIKCVKIRQQKYGKLGNVGMVCFETKEEANTTIQDLNETTRYIQGIWSWKQRINIDNKDTIHANAAKEKEQKSNQLNTVTTEHKVQTTQWTKRSEQNKEQRVNNVITTRTCKESTGCREQERVSTDQLFYGCRSKEHKYKNVTIRMIYL